MKKWLVMASVLFGGVALKAATLAWIHAGKCPFCWGK
jgi:hypothetical protein